MFEYHKKESPIISLLGMGGGIGSYIFTAADTGYEIARSLRFDPSSQSYLDKTFASSGNLTTYTFSFWLKKGINSTFYQNIIIDNDSTSSQIRINDTTGGFELRFAAAGSNAALTTNRKFRDPSAWYHIICVYDSTNATSSDRMRIYVNGVRETSFLAETQPTPSLVSDFMTGGHTYTIGYFNGNTALDGYLADVWFIDGSALEPTEFGTFDDYGVWQPKRYTGSKSGNSFHLPFSDNTSATTLGYDDSGNNNNWDVYNISVWNGGTKMYSVAAFSNSLGYGFTTPGFLPAQSFDGSLTTWAGNNTGGGTNTWTAQSTITVTSSLRVYVVTGAFPSGTTWSVNGVSQGSTSNGWLTATGISTPYTLSTVANTLGSTSTGAFFAAIEVDGSILVDITNPGNDSLRDSPTDGDTANDTGLGGEVPGNYATLNPLDKATVTTLANGNLDYSTTGAGGVRSTIGMSSGKYYAEVTVGHTSLTVGIAAGGTALNNYLGANAGEYGYGQNGYKASSTAQGPYGDTFTTGDVIGIAFDADAGDLYFYKNGTIQASGTPAFSGLTDNTYFFAISNNVATNTCNANFGQRAFAYQNAGVDRPSADYKCLCTANLPDPDIADGSTAMDVALYTGTGSNITVPLDFEPDLVWTKSRSFGTTHLLQNSASGITTQYLQLPAADQEYPGSGGVQSTSATGFVQGTGGAVNVLDRTYVSWAWAAGGEPTTDNVAGAGNVPTSGSAKINGANMTTSLAGSIPAKRLSVNTTAGFSVITWTGTKANASVAHGLGKTPEFIIFKTRGNNYNYRTYHVGVGNTKSLGFNLGQSASTNSSYFNNSSPDASIINLGTSDETNDTSMVAFCFAPIEGYSAAFSFVGNQDSNGPFVHLGFRPRYFIIKCSTGYGEWVIVDSERIGYNNANYQFWTTSASTEIQNGWFDILSNGFKIRTGSSDVNQLNETHIGFAFAENPFKYARAR